jgi:flagellar hook assembly protein FlgD
MLYWEQPAINDFSHFNVYEAINGGAFAKIDSTIGIQYFLTVVNGNYQFYVTTVDQAGHESVPSNTVSANVVVGLPSLTGDISMLKFGPNPFSTQLMIDLKTEKETLLQAEIYDLSGKMVYTLLNSKVSQGYHHYTWNGKNAEGNTLPAGIYTLVVRSGGGKTTFKLVKI